MKSMREAWECMGEYWRAHWRNKKMYQRTLAGKGEALERHRRTQGSIGESMRGFEWTWKRLYVGMGGHGSGIADA